MAHRKAPFKHSRAGVQVNLDDQEREILVHLLGQLDELLDDGRPAGEVDPLEALVGMRGSADETPPVTPEDPALARLLPDGNRDDPEVSSEYRRLTEYGLRSRKRSGARTAASALNRPAPVVLSSEEALSLMKALTDVRLVLGERLELKTDEDAEALHQRLWAGEEAESWMATASIYEVLTAWQEHLVVAVSKRL
ncbi:DUF2017 domain-containing protein [Kineosporia sp. NBRC 101731]|uniref:DUF2017 domain-containing protein n=1 Tax=Kineosporia sp. NBRC 101731 TaxID=3032199 RepID=UPI0024A00FB5|nr:DUF2017 domain-containing protein [Kineosporia sp. NBRC 101731]GLY28299.1 hypothetical protein Kisp02_16640 [Kineosporia sp. NBRC 101731]